MPSWALAANEISSLPPLSFKDDNKKKEDEEESLLGDFGPDNSSLSYWVVVELKLGKTFMQADLNSRVEIEIP